MCVMGGALLLALPAFQWALRHVRSGGHPLANVCYELPSKTAVDGNLVLGALLFGAGWGEQRAGFALWLYAGQDAVLCTALVGWVSVIRVVSPSSSPAAASLFLPATPCCVAGLGGICPGPGLVALASLQPKAFAFIAAMLVRHFV